jgi:hypothetical protein
MVKNHINLTLLALDFEFRCQQPNRLCCPFKFKLKDTAKYAIGGKAMFPCGMLVGTPADSY